MGVKVFLAPCALGLAPPMIINHSENKDTS